MGPGRPVRIACKPEAVVVTCGDGDEAIYAFDHAGRLFTAWLRGRLFRRALDGRIMEKRTDRSDRRPVRHRRFLTPDEGAGLLDASAAAAGEAMAALHSGRAELLWSIPGPEDRAWAAALLEAAARFDARAAEVDSARFAEAYTPVAILPPDRYRSLVIQVTEGCHWNRCTFCTFYRDRRFRIKTDAEFAAHVDAVARFFGPGLSLRRGIFLGDANALFLPVEILLPRLDLLARRLARHATDLAAFIDVFTGHRRAASDFAALGARGLRRIYVGLESGDDETLVFLNKPQTAAQATDLVLTAKQAGLGVGIIVMAGVGGRQRWRRHVEATVATLGAMRLGAGDLVYVSAFTAPHDGPYAQRARADGTEPLTPDEVEDQVDELLKGAARVTAPGIRAARYDIEEFLY
ncbi:MAG: radical SAM protein [Armatimonadota bacterium]|nr:radical SAM protein [Armatimonadota bacterium]